VTREIQAPGPVTAGLWRDAAGVWAAILAHPFLAGLGDGSLDRDAFRFYVVQDAHYLRDYARALSVLSARAPDEEAIRMFAEHAAGAITVERSLHEGFFADFALSEADVAAVEPAPTCLAYTSYLLAAVHAGSFAEGLAAVLPCYWIYREVGRELAARGSSDPLYARWIETYGGEEFGALVDAVLALTEGVGAAAGAGERAAMGRRFQATARYEWMFWEMGWRREGWPV